MKQKFIEGTNKQYSIREDGIIIRHFIDYPNKRRYEDVETKGTYYNSKKAYYWHYYLNQKKIRRYSINKLLKQYFGIYPIGSSSKLIIKERHSLIYKSFYDYPASCITREQKKAYRNKTSPVKIEAVKKRDKKKRKEISRSYAAAKMRITVSEMSEELYELYKAKLKLYRLIKSKKNEYERQELSHTN
jgi:hypothetical protein